MGVDRPLIVTRDPWVFRGSGYVAQRVLVYVRGDDDYLGRGLTDLRGRIEGELSMQLGHDVGIFQDIHDLHTGDRWADALRAGVTKAAFLIPVLTPRFFNRDWCREEVLTFLQIAKDKGLAPRIFPIRFVEWDDEAECEVRAALEPFQYKDFSRWRFESDPTQRSKLLNDFAKDVKARLNLPQVPRPVAKPAAEVMAMQSEVIETAKGKAPDGPKYQTYVVDAFPGRGDFSTIGAAIAAAEPGSKIVVREGTYRESLRLSKPLEIVGEGDRERILVVTDKGSALHCDAPIARVSGMRFRREVGDKRASIWINSGAVEIDDCVVEGLSLSCVDIEGAGSSPRLQRCVMRQGLRGGLLEDKGAQPTIEDCELVGNTMSGVEVRGEATFATLRRCSVRNGEQGGYLFHSGATGLLEHCEAINNGFSGVEIRTGADPVLLACTLGGNKHVGVYVNEGGRGRLKDTTIEANTNAGVVVCGESTIVVTGCTINGSDQCAVLILDSASGGVFRGNDLRDHTRGAWAIAEGALVERVDNRE